MPPKNDDLQLPTDIETASEMLSDPAEINKWLQARRFTDLQDRYNELTRPDLPKQIADILDAREAQNGTIATATKQAMDDWRRENGLMGSAIRRPDLNGDVRAAPPRNAAAKQMEDIGFVNLGDFAREIWHRNPDATRMSEVRKIMNAYSSTEPSLGGFLIPETLDSEIRSLVLEQSIIRQRATAIDMAAPTMLFPFVDVTTHAGGTTFGGWTVTRIEEGAAITPSSARFGRVRLAVSKQVSGAEVPN